MLPELLPYTSEIQLSIGRSDFQGPFDSMQELRDVYSGEEKTEITPMLEMIRDSDWKRGSIVTEIPANSALSLVTDKRVGTPRMLTDVHKQIVNNLKRIFSN